MKLFFFYGSLRTGYWNQRILSEDAEKVGDAVTKDPFTLYVGTRTSVPTVVPSETGPSLHGELYRLNDTDESRVYRLEAGYDQREFDVVTEDGETYTASIFCHTDPKLCRYLCDGYVVVPSGDYTTFIKPNGDRV